MISQPSQENHKKTDPKTVCVYCGSSLGNDPRYEAATIELGRKMVANDIRLVYGGGHIGLMGVIADSVLEAGGYAIGIIPEHIHVRELQHTSLSELIVVDSMHTRKRLMADKSEAFIVLPGGYGTLDETFEIITWKHLDLHQYPIILLNVGGYWDTLIKLVEHQIAAGFIHSAKRDIFTVVDTVDEAIALLMKTPTEPTIPVPDIR